MCSLAITKCQKLGSVFLKARFSFGNWMSKVKKPHLIGLLCYWKIFRVLTQNKASHVETRAYEKWYKKMILITWENTVTLYMECKSTCSVSIPRVMHLPLFYYSSDLIKALFILYTEHFIVNKVKKMEKRGTRGRKAKLFKMLPCALW